MEKTRDSPADTKASENVSDFSEVPATTRTPAPVHADHNAAHRSIERTEQPNSAQTGRLSVGSKSRSRNENLLSPTFSQGSSNPNVKFLASGAGNSGTSEQPLDLDQRLTRPVSIMRRFLDKGTKFEWPSEMGKPRGDYRYIRPSASIFVWKKRVSYPGFTDVAVYRAAPPLDFAEDFVIKADGPGFSTEDHTKQSRSLEKGMSLRHPHCIKILEVFVNRNGLGNFILFPAPRCHLMSLLGAASVSHKPDGRSSKAGSVSQGGVPSRFSHVESIRVLRQSFVCLCQGLSYLHGSGIERLDISPSYIRIDDQGSVLIDFLPDWGVRPQELDWYASPEKTGVGNRDISGSSDVFSLGCVFLEIATVLLGRGQLGRDIATPLPYYANLEQVYNWIEDLGHRTSHEPGLTPEPLSSLPVSSEAALRKVNPLHGIRSMLEANPENRPVAPGLWECFKDVSWEVCADCDPRHPDAWRPSEPTDTTRELGLSATKGNSGPLTGSSQSESDVSHLPIPPEESVTGADGTILDSTDSASAQSLEIGKEPTVKATQVERPYYSSLMRKVLGGLKVVSEFLELCENTLQPGYRRIRWTCVCGARLFDDFKELAAGELDGLQHFLNNTAKASQLVHDAPSSDNRQGSMGTLVGSSFCSTEMPPDGRPANTTDTTDVNSLPSGLRRRKQSGSSKKMKSVGYDMWVLPIFELGPYRNKVKHLPVDSKMPDDALFMTFKTQYLNESSRVRRFFAMRAVKKISYVKFIHAPREPDIHKFDDWPSQKDSPPDGPWTYKGCPAKKKHIPLVGHNYLMHLWQNPSHCDLQTYESRSPNVFIRISRRIHHLVGRHRQETDDENSPATTETTASNEHSHDMELGHMHSSGSGSNAPSTQETLGPRSSYVFLRTPRKLGEQLEANDEDPPVAWGLYFEEGFRVHHFFFIVLLLYIMASLGFAIYWCERYGLVGPHSGSGAFGVASWMIGLVSLVVTVWFKWAE
ncbi:MAG: hypothetical protein LQ338_008100 [Usnochroma carphineum]|nr:MAG: hypothetical protein LQ338_008100 [Usnochroma carphineum]